MAHLVHIHCIFIAYSLHAHCMCIAYMHTHCMCIAYTIPYIAYGQVGELLDALADVQQHAGEVGGDREQVVLGDGVGLEVVHRTCGVGLDQVERLEDHVLAPHTPVEG